MSLRLVMWVALVALLLASMTFLWSAMRSLGQCERVQVLRSQHNQNAAVIYRALSNVKDPYLRSLATGVTWTPPTDCQAASLNPLGYEPPRPIRFADTPNRVVDRMAPPPPK